MSTTSADPTDPAQQGGERAKPTSTVHELAHSPLARIRRPRATPSDGPDPYGNPDPDPRWMQIDWQRHLRRVVLEFEPRPDGQGPVGEVPLNVVEMGAGERTLLLVHGVGGCWQNFLETIPVLAESHRVIAVDLPGFGGSPMPEWELSMPAYGRVVKALADELGADRATIAGNSMGGLIGVETVLRSPDRFDHLVLLSAAGVSSATAAARPVETGVRVMQAFTPLALALQKRTVRRPRIRTIGFGGVFAHPRRLRYELLVEQLVGGAGRPGFVPAMRAMLGYHVLDQLEQIEIPVTIVVGRSDVIVPPRDGAVYAEHISHAELEVFDDCGHLPQLERPLRTNRLLERLLDS